MEKARHLRCNLTCAKWSPEKSHTINTPGPKMTIGHVYYLVVKVIFFGGFPNGHPIKDILINPEVTDRMKYDREVTCGSATVPPAPS